MHSHLCLGNLSVHLYLCAFCVDETACVTHHKHFLHFGDSLAEYGAELISNTSQKEAKQWDPQQRIDDAEYSSAFSVGRGVPKACTVRNRDYITSQLMIPCPVVTHFVQHILLQGRIWCLVQEKHEW